MGSLGTGELVVIAFVALIVFGPKRLPEIARKAGELLAKAREATRSVTTALDGEYDELTAPLQTLKADYDATLRDIKSAAASVGSLSVELPKEPAADTSKPASDEVSDTEEVGAENDTTPDTAGAGEAETLNDATGDASVTDEAKAPNNATTDTAGIEPGTGTERPSPTPDLP